MNRNGLLLLIVLSLLVGSMLSAQTIEEQTITSAYNYLAIQDYERAYSFINFVLKLNTGEDLDPEVRNLAESIYFNYLKYLLDNEEYVVYETVKLNLTTFPQVNSIRIQQLLQQSEARIAYERQVQVDEESRQQQQDEERQLTEEASRLRMLELEQERAINAQMLEIKRLEVEELVRRDDMFAADLEYRAASATEDRRQQQQFNQALLTVVATDRADTGLSAAIIVVLSAVAAVVILGFGMLIVMFIRNSRQQQQFFEYTVSQTRQPRNILSLPVYTAPITDGSHMIEHTPDRKLLPTAEPDMERLKALIQKCREISVEIDERTRRKNTTRNVAELVYKISTFMGYDEGECMLFLAVGMAYDIGFLEIDQSIFEQAKLTDEQFELLKSHTTLGESRIDFVPEEYRPVFRAIRNQTDAIAVLMQETEKYDPDILYAITSVV